MQHTPAEAADKTLEKEHLLKYTGTQVNEQTFHSENCVKLAEECVQSEYYMQYSLKTLQNHEELLKELKT